MRFLPRALRKTLHRRIVYPSILALRGELGMYEALDRLRELQWASREELRQHQLEALRETLAYSFDHVPLYRERWSALPSIEAKKAPALLRSLPFLTKEDLQERAEALISDARPGRVTRKTTGGSTGEPVTVLKDRGALARERAASWLGYGWYDVEIGDLGARFWGSPRELGKRRLRFAAADVAMNRIRFSAFSFGERELESYWEKCLRVRPDYFYGYVSMLSEFARWVREGGRDGDRIGLKAIITTAEALTEPQRQLLGEVFRAPVQNEYGCGELGPIAYECPHGSLHMVSSNLYVEIVDEEGEPVDPGESGEVIVTDLVNRAMPLVRYRVGDRAVQGSDCACGRGLPVLEEVRGRAYDFVKDSRGRRYHGEYFMYLFEDLRDRGAQVTRFRVTQRSARRLEIEIVHPSKLKPEQESFIEERLSRDMPEMEITIDYVDAIERAPSGKVRVIRNDWLKSPEEPSG